MATTLPVFTRTIDNAFMETWYDIKPKAVDNILLATVVWAALVSHGCLDGSQKGGKIITESIKYGVGPQAIGVEKGDTLPMGEVETETMASWRWRKLVSHAQRSLIDDQENTGDYQIKDYVTKRLTEARDSMSQQYETDLFRAMDSTETAHKYIQSLNDIVPPYADRATGTYGGIDRSNTWWQPKYKQWTLPKEINLVPDMRNLYNTIGENKADGYPNLIITDQTMFELYDDIAEDKTQIVRSGNSKVADLGYEMFKFKGADLIYTPNMTAGEMLMLNTRYIKLKYDPRFWFAMGEWKTIANQFERIAHIISICNLICNQLRRQGRLYN